MKLPFDGLAFHAAGRGAGAGAGAGADASTKSPVIQPFAGTPVDKRVCEAASERGMHRAESSYFRADRLFNDIDTRTVADADLLFRRSVRPALYEARDPDPSKRNDAALIKAELAVLHSQRYLVNELAVRAWLYYEETVAFAANIVREKFRSRTSGAPADLRSPLPAAPSPETDVLAAAGGPSAAPTPSPAAAQSSAATGATPMPDLDVLRARAVDRLLSGQITNAMYGKLMGDLDKMAQRLPSM